MIDVRYRPGQFSIIALTILVCSINLVLAQQAAANIGQPRALVMTKPGIDWL